MQPGEIAWSRCRQSQGVHPVANEHVNLAYQKPLWPGARNFAGKRFARAHTTSSCTSSIPESRPRMLGSNRSTEAFAMNFSTSTHFERWQRLRRRRRMACRLERGSPAQLTRLPYAEGIFPGNRTNPTITGSLRNGLSSRVRVVRVARNVHGRRSARVSVPATAGGEGSAFAQHMKDARLAIPTPDSL